ncbi:MAG TPA: hypothetical protein VFE61_31980 [Candidatus Sulfotelmatobacter sp.]|jgi:hypothetical protein|nr:hypothetical protein [Candidatus Sulfotelmatobacter sp.]
MGPLRRSAIFIELITFFLVLFATCGAVPAAAQMSVTTYHYDNFRTGWNQKETALTPATVASSSFGLLATVTLDEQVDAQPLVVPNVTITAGKFQGKRAVAYVVTENNTVYAIGAGGTVVLLTRNLGKPVYRPLTCIANGPYVGINSTPVIDVPNNTLYVIAYVQEAASRQYYLHALDMGNLTDKVPPRVVGASHTLTDGTSFTFNATYERQRPGLLLANGNVYAGFGSFCDMAPDLSRGWVLGWNAASLAPLPANQVLDTQASSPNTYFLSSIWMSGFALTADATGNVLFVTGNSDAVGTTYDGISNLQESVVKVSPDLTTVLDVFTPANQAQLDAIDADFGSGGVLVLPKQLGTVPHMAVAAGKSGKLFLMNEDKLGGFSPTKNNVLGAFTIGPCFCGPSYYVGADNIPRIVSSGGRIASVWKLQTSPKPLLTAVTHSPALVSGQSPGFFTTVSSNGQTNAIIWAVSHPASVTSNGIFLYAFDPSVSGTMKQLFQGTAGSWPNFKANANLVPVVANGRVYVASNKQLQIFGLK